MKMKTNMKMLFTLLMFLQEHISVKFSLALPTTSDLDYSQCLVTEMFQESNPSGSYLEKPEKFSNISSLGLAIIGNKTQEIEALLSGICDPNDNKTLHTPRCNVHYCGWDGFPFTAGLSNLHIAVMKGNQFALEKLLAVENIVVDSHDENGETPFVYAVRLGTVKQGDSHFGFKSSLSGDETEVPKSKLKMLNLLVVGGADLETVNKDGETALMQAVSIGQEEVVQFIINKGADLNVISKSGASVLNYAFNGNHHWWFDFNSVWDLLFNSMKDQGLLDDNRNFSLAFAVREGNLEQMKTLVEKDKADIEDGFALSIAIKERNFEAIKYLVESGGKLDSETEEEAARGRIDRANDNEVLKYLVELGAVPDNKYTCLYKGTCHGICYTC